MSGGGGSHDEEHDPDAELWLVSYSDMMTLLFGFFVLMYVFASAKSGDAEKVREGLAKSFGGTYVPPYEQLAEDLAAAAKDDPIMNLVEIQEPKDGMEITFRSNLLFDSGKADLRPDVLTTMSMIAKLISKNVDNAEIFIGGHTDDAPISTRKFPSNWELSTARAASVVREFIKNGYEPKMMVAMGYAETRPAYPNRDVKNIPIKENREKNRRVVIKVVAPGLVKQPNQITKPDGTKGDRKPDPVPPSSESAQPKLTN